MGWGRPKRGGWGPSGGTLTGEAEPVSGSPRSSAPLSAWSGGVIRYGKDGPEDDGHVGFWVGRNGGGRGDVFGRGAGVLAEVGRLAAAGAGEDLT